MLGRNRQEMAEIYFSDFFDVDPDDIERHGAFDISLVNDLPLFVDPFLLFNSDKPLYQELHDDVIEYMRFLKSVSVTGTLDPGLIQSWFTFPEVKQNWLGYSEAGNRGRGLGGDFANALHRNFRTVFSDFGEETVTRSSHIEKLCLVRDGVGRDNISDFTTNLIKGFLAEFTQQFAAEHLPATMKARVPLSRVRFDYETRSWVTRQYELPIFNGDFVLLTPKDILTKDETWINRSELIQRFRQIADSVPNEVLRAQVNEYLLRVLPRGRRVRPREVREALALAIDQFPAVIDYYILDREKRGQEAEAVSKARVAEVQRRFVEQVRLLVSQFLVPIGFYGVAGRTYTEARQRVDFLKDVIENKGGHRIFYVDGVPVQRESDLHILYRLTWFASLSDVSTEVNDGRGPADFKISRGAPDKTLVEFKLAKNSHLERNLSKQTAVYEKASDAKNPSIKVILYFTLAERKRVDAILKRLGLTNHQNVVLIDARADNKPSGSKA